VAPDVNTETLAISGNTFANLNSKKHYFTYNQNAVNYPLSGYKVNAGNLQSVSITGSIVVTSHLYVAHFSMLCIQYIAPAAVWLMDIYCVISDCYTEER